VLNSYLLGLQKTDRWLFSFWHPWRRGVWISNRKEGLQSSRRRRRYRSTQTRAIPHALFLLFHRIFHEHTIVQVQTWLCIFQEGYGVGHLPL
jgi:hypothetical protein